MKLIRNLPLAAIAVLAFYSCKKEHLVPEPVPGPVTYADYSNLKVGNYWVYQVFEVDSLGGIVTPTNDYDSCYVEKDTTIRGNVYHKLLKYVPASWPAVQAYYLRDSLSYTVNSSGTISFSSSDFTTVFLNFTLAPPPVYDTIYTRTDQMFDERASSLVVPAGTFRVLDYRKTYAMRPPYYTTGGYNRILHARYAKDIGLVAETLDFYAAVPTMKERRLLRYHVN